MKKIYFCSCFNVERLRRFRIYSNEKRTVRRPVKKPVIKKTTTPIKPMTSQSNAVTTAFGLNLYRD
jgi:hypothetical protein